MQSSIRGLQVRPTTWQDLEIFLAIAESGSQSAAAYQLGISQSMVSRRLTRLEEQSGVILFRRSGSGLHLTAVGDELAKYLRRTDVDLKQLLRDLKRVEDNDTGPVRIAVAEILGGEWLTSLLPKLQEIFPGIRVEILTARRTVDLALGDADIAISLAGENPTGVKSTPVGRVLFAPYASRDYMARRADTAGSEIAGHSTIDFTGYHGLHIFAVWLTHLRVDAPSILMTDSVTIQWRAVRIGLGVAMLPLLPQSPKPPDLVQFEAPICRAVIRAAVHTDSLSMRRIRIVHEFLVDAGRRAFSP